MAIAWQKEARRTAWWDTSIRIGYVFLQEIDLVLTVVAVSFGSIELNPIIRSLLAAPVLLITAKLIIPILIAWLIPGRLLLPAFSFLFLIVIWNIKELLVLLL